MFVNTMRFRNTEVPDDADLSDIDQELDEMTQALPPLERVVARRARHGLAPILEPDDDFEEFDTSAYLERTYQ